MPGMDGLTLARAIKSDSSIAGTRLVALTSLGQACTTAELELAEIATYLVKPIKKSRLFDCLVNAMGKDLARDTFARSESAASPARSSQRDPQSGIVRILLAEDNHINQLIAVDQLRKLGYVADVVPNGLAVLEALKLVPYDIILMDCQMPEMDGYDAATAIRIGEQTSDPGFNLTARVYIIAITANAMKGDREKCLAAGMDDYVSKPIRLPQLQAALERWKAAIQDKCGAQGVRQISAAGPPRNLPLCRLLPLNRAQFDRSSFSLRQQLVVLNRFPSVPPRIRHTTRNQKVRRCNPTMESSPKCRRGQKLLLGWFASMVTASMVGVRTRRNSRVGADDDCKFKNSVPGQEPDIL